MDIHEIKNWKKIISSHNGRQKANIPQDIAIHWLLLLRKLLFEKKKERKEIVTGVVTIQIFDKVGQVIAFVSFLAATGRCRAEQSDEK